MAGFVGMPLGSFSGRGADFQPMQFIMQLRQRQAEAEQARKDQAAATQQSFLMSMMAQKQRQQELLQRQAEAAASRDLEQQNQRRLADQFRSEQARLQGQEQRRLDADRAAQTFRESQIAKAEEEKRALRTQDENTRALASNVRAAAASGMERRYSDLVDGVLQVDPLEALDRVERDALAEASKIDDPDAKAMAVEEARAWRASKEKQIMSRESLRSVMEARKAQAEDRAENRKRLETQEAGRRKVAVARARIATLTSQNGPMANAKAELALADTPEEKKAARDKIAKLEQELQDLNVQLAEME